MSSAFWWSGETVAESNFVSDDGTGGGEGDVMESEAMRSSSLPPGMTSGITMEVPGGYAAAYYPNGDLDAFHKCLDPFATMVTLAASYSTPFSYENWYKVSSRSGNTCLISGGPSGYTVKQLQKACEDALPDLQPCALEDDGVSVAWNV